MSKRFRIILPRYQLEKKNSEEVEKMSKSAFQEQFIKSLLWKEIVESPKLFSKNTKEEVNQYGEYLDSTNFLKKVQLNEKEKSLSKNNSYSKDENFQKNQQQKKDEFNSIQKLSDSEEKKVFLTEESRKSVVEKYIDLKNKLKNIRTSEGYINEMSQAEKTRFKILEGLQSMEMKKKAIFESPSPLKNKKRNLQFKPILTHTSEVSSSGCNHFNYGKVKVSLRRCNHKLINSGDTQTLFKEQIKGSSLKREDLFNNSTLASAVRPRSYSNILNSQSQKKKQSQKPLPFFSQNKSLITQVSSCPQPCNWIPSHLAKNDFRINYLTPPVHTVISQDKISEKQNQQQVFAIPASIQSQNVPNFEELKKGFFIEPFKSTKSVSTSPISKNKIFQINESNNMKYSSSFSFAGNQRAQTSSGIRSKQVSLQGDNYESTINQKNTLESNKSINDTAYQLEVNFKGEDQDDSSRKDRISQLLTYFNKVAVYNPPQIKINSSVYEKRLKTAISPHRAHMPMEKNENLNSYPLADQTISPILQKDLKFDEKLNNQERKEKSPLIIQKIRPMTPKKLESMNILSQPFCSIKVQNQYIPQNGSSSSSLHSLNQDALSIISSSYASSHIPPKYQSLNNYEINHNNQTRNSNNRYQKVFELQKPLKISNSYKRRTNKSNSMNRNREDLNFSIDSNDIFRLNNKVQSNKKSQIPLNLFINQNVTLSTENPVSDSSYLIPKLSTNGLATQS